MRFSKIYLNQSNLKLTLDTQVLITGATLREIRFIKPDGTIDHFDAIEENETSISYELTGTELDMTGIWTFWAYVIFSDGRNAAGEPVRIIVNDESR